MNLFRKLFAKDKKVQHDSLTPARHFDNTEALMDEDTFWLIIQSTKDKADNDYQKQQGLLKTELLKLSPEEIILFNNRFRYFRGESYHWDLWGAIYIINGGCGDDSFNDFREWVIAQGKDFYYKTIKNPETLAELNREEIDEDWEGFGYIPNDAFNEITGQDIPNAFKENFEIKGEKWEEDSDVLKEKFPNVAAKFPEYI
ncbi:DUF4240 domain-containing protein [Flavobacterium rhizosphaerae]|uniref:DUF4240 domain-containing protein n=1 Tax=Flavobacterium rhizosphaerae TaxID=3163298 RepID=A0ABW8YSS6_9FLAO